MLQNGTIPHARLPHGFNDFIQRHPALPRPKVVELERHQPDAKGDYVVFCDWIFFGLAVALFMVSHLS